MIEALESSVCLSLNQIDQVCDRFEAEWSAGGRPSIAEYLRCVDETLRKDLLVELVRTDVEYRQRIGELLTRRDYGSTFPEYGEAIARLDVKFADPIDQTDLGFQSIGSLCLIREVGRGSSGTVWKAWDSELERLVAVKFATRFDSDDLCFERESKAAARFEHPHIVSVYRTGRHNQQLYLVLQYIDGTTLRSVCKSRPDHKLSVSLCAKIARALDHAHRHGVIHRDVKPANVLIDRDGEPHIADFGLARRLDASTTLTTPGTLVGSLAYMSPEQASGDTTRVDARTDVYALGAVLYELLTGQQVYSGEPREILNQILRSTPKPPRSLARSVPADLEAICLKAIARDPADRYPTASDLADDLELHAAGLPVRARPVSLLMRMAHAVRRRRPTVGRCAAAVTLAVALIAILKFSQPEFPRNIDFEPGTGILLDRTGWEHPDSRSILVNSRGKTSLLALGDSFDGGFELSVQSGIDYLYRNGRVGLFYGLHLANDEYGEHWRYWTIDIRVSQDSQLTLSHAECSAPVSNPQDVTISGRGNILLPPSDLQADGLTIVCDDSGVLSSVLWNESPIDLQQFHGAAVPGRFGIHCQFTATEFTRIRLNERELVFPERPARE